MRKYILLSIFVLSSILLVQAQNNNLVTQDAAWDKVKEKIVKDLNGVNVYASSSVLAPNKAIATWNGEEKAPSYESWFFFIDDMPFCNWTHPCRYVYVDTREGKVTIMSKRHPPLNIEMKPLIQKTIKNTHRSLNIPKHNSHGRKQSGSRSLHQYAIIISGGGSTYYNWERYWNDCSAIYQVLVNVYGYSKQNIYVLMADGTNPNIDRHMNDGTYESSPLDLDGDGLADIQYDATRSSITSVFNTLSNTLTEEDDLFIFTTDHGDRIDGNHVVMCLWNGEIFHDYEFASCLNNISAKQINICMEQCYSGGFIDNISRNNVVISTACRYDEPSHARQDFLYDEYVYHWISAVAGETPSGVLIDADNNNDGYVSMIEAFEYANYHDATYEFPQYNSNPSFLGDITNLMGTYIFSISGSDKLYNSSGYSVQNLPSGYTTSWSLTGSNASNFTLQTDSLSTNQCTITRKDHVEFSGSTYLLLTAQISRNDTVITTLTKGLDALYISGESNPCLTDVYHVEGLPSDYTVTWNLSGTGYSVITDFVPTNTENNNYLGVQRASSQSYANGTITATLMSGNNVVGTLTKRISSGWDFTGTWFKTSSIFPPFIPDTTPQPLNCGMTIVNTNERIVLQSDDFIGATMSCTSGNAIIFPHSNTIVLTTGSDPLTSTIIEGYKSGTCEAYKFNFRPIGEPIPLEFSINGTGHEYVFSLREKQNSERGDEHLAESKSLGQWQLAILQYETGQIVFKENVEDKSLSVNTSKWKAGVYIAVAIINGKSIAQKLAITK